LVYKERCVDGEAQVQEHMHIMRETINQTTEHKMGGVHDQYKDCYL